MEKEKIDKLSATHSFTVMPKDCNFNRRSGSQINDTLFGGKLMYEMDYAGAKIARRATYDVEIDAIVTASTDKINFERPAFIGDLITMTAVIKALGRSSIQIRIKVKRESLKGEVEQICSANMTFVTIKNGVPFPHELSFENLS
jgi:acyl-CoA hydrolase